MKRVVHVTLSYLSSPMINDSNNIKSSMSKNVDDYSSCFNTTNVQDFTKRNTRSKPTKSSLDKGKGVSKLQTYRTLQNETRDPNLQNLLWTKERVFEK